MGQDFLVLSQVEAELAPLVRVLHLPTVLMKKIGDIGGGGGVEGGRGMFERFWSSIDGDGLEREGF